MPILYKIKLFFFFAINYWLIASDYAHAAIIDYKLEMPLLVGQKSATGLSQYVKMVFIYGLSMVGVVALLAVVYSGFRYLISGSSDTQRTESKKGMWAALSGVVLLIFSFAILYTINPQLVSLKEPNMDKISVGAPAPSSSSNSPYSLEMPLPGAGQTAPNNLGDYIRNIFLFGIALTGFAALFAISYGAFVYFISGGNQSMKTYGRQWIVSALSGLTLLILSFAILYTINPQLTTLNLDQLKQVNIGSAPSALDNTNGAYRLEMPLPGAGQTAPNDLGGYIRNFFLFGVAAVGMAALFALAYGGIIYIFSAGSSSAQTHAKSWITSALSGVVLLICSFAILYTINPQLTTLRLDQLKQVNVGSAPSALNSSTGAYKLEMPLSSNTSPNQAPSDFVRLFFIYGLGLAGITALFALSYGGLQYIIRAGSETAKTEGKQWIFGALSGITLLICSFLILYTINPQLTVFQNPKLDTISIQPHLGLGYYNFNSFSDISGTPYKNTTLLAPELESAIQNAASYYGVSPDFVKAVMGVESNKDGNAVSPKGAQGLMQLMPGTAKEMGVTDSFDGRQNIWGGVGYIAKIISQYSQANGFAPTVENVLRAYNAGPYGVRASYSYKETNAYVAKITSITGLNPGSSLSANKLPTYKIPNVNPASSPKAM